MFDVASIDGAIQSNPKEIEGFIGGKILASKDLGAFDVEPRVAQGRRDLGQQPRAIVGNQAQDVQVFRQTAPDLEVVRSVAPRDDGSVLQRCVAVEHCTIGGWQSGYEVRNRSGRDRFGVAHDRECG